MPELPIPDSESSLLRSPKANDGSRGTLGESVAKARGNSVQVGDQAMDIAKLNGKKVSRAVDNLLPTPVASEGTKAPAQQTSEVKGKTGQVWLSNIAKDLQPPLLGTPRTSSANSSTKKQVEAGAPKARLEDQVHTTNWGRFEPAIRRWEAILGRIAPAPTKADGKDGAHRLSSVFTEWMMGLPEGWVTSVGLTRAKELKACGNGVVPQQAELALKILITEDVKNKITQVGESDK